MSICKLIISQMGGKAEVKSKVAEGTQFIFTVPFRTQGNLAEEPSDKMDEFSQAFNRVASTECPQLSFDEASPEEF